jgi:hypothetical protein
LPSIQPPARVWYDRPELTSVIVDSVPRNLRVYTIYRPCSSDSRVMINLRPQGALWRIGCWCIGKIPRPRTLLKADSSFHPSEQSLSC